MLAALVVATLAATQPAEAVEQPGRKLVFEEAPAMQRADAVQRCPAAGVMHTAYEPALLLRPQDRADAKSRKLIDLPMGRLCLAGGAEPERRAKR